MKRPSMVRLWCSEGQSEPVPDEKYKSGFIKEKPDEYFLNQMQKDEESFYVANMESGVPTGNLADSVTYAKDAIYFKSGKVFVRKSTGDVESYFTRPYPTVEAELRAFYNKLATHSNDTKAPHKETPAQVGTYSKAEFDTLNNSQGSNLDKHVKDVSNPHKVSYTQIKCLGDKTGGKFTGAVEFLKSIKVGTCTAEAKGTEFVFGKDGATIGVSSIEPIAYIPTGRQILFHEGNYLTERNKLEPVYAVPTPILKASLKSSLNFLYGHTTLDTSWDSLVFTSDGLTISGKVSSSDPTKIVCQEQTIRFIPKGDVSVQVGGVIISAKSGTTTIKDNDEVVWTGVVGGSITYARKDSEGAVYLDGVLVTKKSHAIADCPLIVEVSGSGSIKDFTIWADYLNKEQAAKVG